MRNMSQGLKPAEGLRVPGVCRKQPESGAEVESRAVSGLAGPVTTGARRRQGPWLTVTPGRKSGPTPAWRKLKCVLRDAL